MDVEAAKDKTPFLFLANFISLKTKQHERNMSPKEIVFRVFISSTFSDFKVERNVLQQYAFKNLRKYCQNRRARFHSTDLRWSVKKVAGSYQEVRS